MIIKLKNSVLKEMLKKFWASPNDAFLKSVEVCVWQSLKPDIRYPLLNIGCGDGAMDESLFNGFKKMVGLDNNKRSVELAKKSGLYSKVIQSGAEKMPFKSDRFKTVISNSTYEHIKKDKEAVKEVSRVLKKNGHFIFSVTSKRLLDELKDVMDQNELTKFNKRMDHNHYRSLSEWKRVLKDNHLKLIDHLYYHPRKNIQTWVNLVRFSTFVPYKREMWSYLRDSKITPLLPKKLIANTWYYLLKNKFSKALEGKGTWLFIIAKKV